MSRSLVRTFWFAGCVAAGLASCGDSTDEKLRAIELAGQCSLNSECEGDLVCIFERCHVQCAEDDDCRPPHMPYQSRCVRSPSGVNVCQLEDDRDCKNASDCQGDQICAADGECRDDCSDDEPCIEGLVCSIAGECARADELDAQGRLTKNQGTGGGGAPSSGAGGEPGTGGTAGTHEGDGGDANPDPSPSGGAGDGASAGAPSGDGGESGAAPKSVLEVEPNDSPGEAQTLGIETTMSGSISPPQDLDYYSLTTPSGPEPGGYFRLYLTDMNQSSGAFDVRAVLNNGSVVSDSSGLTAGKSLFGFFSASPGAEFRVLVSRWNGGAVLDFDYHLFVDYTPVEDVHEPNDTQLEASPIELGEPVTAFVFAGLESSTVNAAAYVDWYELPSVAAGKLHVNVGNVPLNVRLLARVFDAATLTGLGIEQAGSMAGAPLSFDVDLPSSGTYLIRVRPDGAPPAAAGSTDSPGEVPDHFTRPYTLTVTQP